MMLRKPGLVPNVIKLMWRRDTLSSEMMRGYFFFLNILDTMVGLCGRFYWSYIKPNKSGPLIRGKTHTWKEVFKWMQHVWNDLWSNKYFGLNIMYTSNRIDLILHNHRNQKENALQLCESLSTDRIIYKVKFIFIICSEGGFSFIPHYLWGWLSWLRRSRRWVQMLNCLESRLQKEKLRFSSCSTRHTTKILQSPSVVRRFPALCGAELRRSKCWNYNEVQHNKGPPELPESPQKWSW
jgi:hypothetical protein